MGHYLTVMKWRPHFNPRDSTIQKTLVWIRLPELSVEYFNPELLMDVRNQVGKAVKVDDLTLQANRGRYARVCVELDLGKKLTPQIKLGGSMNFLQRIEYEGLYAICFECG